MRRRARVVAAAVLVIVAAACGQPAASRSSGTPADGATSTPTVSAGAPVSVAASAPVVTTAGSAAPVALAPELSAQCPTTPHGAAVDRDRQRAWLCDRGVALYEFAFTGAISQPDIGTYAVYAKDLESSSSSWRGVSRMTHFVAFTYGKFRGARIAFHSMPTWSDGEFVQPLQTVGDLDRRGESAGCLRLLPDDAVRVWDWLSVGDEVHVVT